MVLQNFVHQRTSDEKVQQLKHLSGKRKLTPDRQENQTNVNSDFKNQKVQRVRMSIPYWESMFQFLGVLASPPHQTQRH
jgi:hypothetical protein